MQLPGKPLAFFEGSLAPHSGEEADVLHRHGGLVGDSPLEDLLVLAGLLLGKVVQVDRAQSASP